MKRTFIAVPLQASERLLDLLGKLRQKLTGEDIKWVEPDNLHITLKFLGDTADNQLNSVAEKLDLACSMFGKQAGKLTGLDTFSYKGNPSVLFSRLTELTDLGRIADAIDLKLEEAGFAPETRRFRPHLTLARMKKLEEKRRFYDLIGLFRETDIQDVKVEKIVLYESILQPPGPVYIPLKTIELH